MGIAPGADGQIVLGLAGRPEQAYAPDTDDIVKILAEHGLRLTYDKDDAERPRLLLKGAVDWWGPILVFTQTALANGAGTILANAIWEIIGGKRAASRPLSIDVGCARDSDGEVSWFRGRGSAEDVLQAMTIWKGE